MRDTFLRVTGARVTNLRVTNLRVIDPLVFDARIQVSPTCVSTKPDDSPSLVPFSASRERDFLQPVAFTKSNFQSFGPFIDFRLTKSNL